MLTGSVEVGARPRPVNEEDMLVKKSGGMADMGYGLTRESVMELAFTIVQKSERRIPFMLERLVVEGFRQRHSYVSSPPLSYCRAISSNQATVPNFFGKLGSLYGRLNLITKPMQG